MLNGFQESQETPYIRWSHYIDVYENYIKRTSNSPTKVCPKITLRHLHVDGFSKMNVKLATQVKFEKTIIKNKYITHLLINFRFLVIPWPKVLNFIENM